MRAGLVAVLLLGAGAGTAHAGERAVLTWDTDATDVDLHIWDEFGNHASFADRDAIPDTELSTDIRFGYGPERFEEFEGEEGRSYTYGVCYFTSNRDDGVVPDTVATVELTDPNGGRRTLQRVLRTKKEAYYLGASPAGATPYVPDDDWCSGGPYHPADDSGPDPTQTGGGNGSFEGCARTRRRIGVVEVCADRVGGQGPQYSAEGNVRVNGAVLLGDGPVSLHVDDKKIVAPGSTVRVVRDGQTLPVVFGDVEIAAAGTRDELSGREGLAQLDVTAARPEVDALRAAGLPLTLAGLAADRFRLFVDGRDGGGVIAAARVQLPFAANKESAGAVAVGVHSRSAAAVRVLGGQAQFGEITLPGNWGLNAFTLSYSEATNAWSASGGLKTPYFGLDLAGGLADGRLDSLGVKVSRDVPLGTTGFILSSVGGGVSGLAVPPLRISASASGRWGSVPGIQSAGLVLLENVTLTVDLSGSASLKGAVKFIHHGSPVKGRLDLGFRLDPFRAHGSLGAEAKLLGVEVSTHSSMTMTSSAFTALGSAQGKFRGLQLGQARSVVSNRGIGATGQVRFCVFGRCLREDLGFGMAWDEFPTVRWIGADINRFVTASQTGPRTVTVADDRPFLFVDAVGPAGTTPDFAVRGPGGRRWTTASPGRDATVVRDPANGFSGLTILRPKAGRYVVSADGTAATRFTTQAVRRVDRVRVTRLGPVGSVRKPLRRTGPPLLLRWSSRGLGSRTRVAVYVTPNAATLGTRVAANRPARGSVRIPRRLLARGGNRVRLVVTDRGAPVDNQVGRTVIRVR